MPLVSVIFDPNNTQGIIRESFLAVVKNLPGIVSRAFTTIDKERPVAPHEVDVDVFEKGPHDIWPVALGIRVVGAHTDKREEMKNFLSREMRSEIERLLPKDRGDGSCYVCILLCPASFLLF